MKNSVSNIKKYSTIYLIFLCIFISLFTHSSFAQSNVEKPARILFLVDGSSSMTYNWQSNETRNKVASRVINAICDSIFKVNKDVEFAVRTYGTQFPSQNKNCTDTRLEVPFTDYYNIQNLKSKVSQIRAYGYSPIAYSLQQAAEQDFAFNDLYAYSIILITDGGESCGGDICAIMQQLISKKIAFKPYIISLVNDDLLAQQYACLGTYLPVTNNNDIVTSIQTIINNNRKILEVKKIPIIANNPPKVIDTPKPVINVTPKVDTPKTIVVQKTDTPTTTIQHNTIFVTKLPYKNNISKVPVKYSNKTIVGKKINSPQFKFLYPILEEPNIIPPITTVMVEKVKSPLTLKKLTRIQVVPEIVGRKAKFPNGKYVYTFYDEPSNNNVVVKQHTPNNNSNTNKTNTTVPVNNNSVMKFTTETAPAEKTLLKVFLVSKQGKQYPAQPQLNITNTITKVTDKKYRTVTNGQPNPMEIEAGKYNISIGATAQYAKDVVIEPNKMNIVTIILEQATISFAYEGNSKRPVKEFVALISNRFESKSPVVTHPCNERLFYEPANYHIEINTLPPTTLNMDLEPNVAKIIYMKETGVIAINNTNNLGRIEFWYRSGTSQRFFYAMNIKGDGNLANQQQEFLPGIYEVRYMKPGTDKLTIKNISIKSNETTAITLE